MTLVDVVNRHRDDLSPAERRVVDVLLAHPDSVAFGTVAAVAEQARTSGATVVRLADHLGFEGYRGLQASVQAELSDRLRPAAERIRERPANDFVGRSLADGLANLEASLASVDRGSVRSVAALLAAPSRRVWIVAGSADRAVAALLVDRLGMLRDDVESLSGDEVSVAALLSRVRKGDVVIAVDLRRYERWVVATTTAAAGRGARVIAVTDGPLAPLARLAEQTFTVTADAAGPFDSVLATVAIAEMLISAVAARLRPRATARLSAVEAAWRTAAVLRDS